MFALHKHDQTTHYLLHILIVTTKRFREIPNFPNYQILHYHICVIDKLNIPLT